MPIYKSNKKKTRSKVHSNKQISGGGKSCRMIGQADNRRIGWRWLLVIFLVAMAFRGLCFLVIGEHPLYRYPVVDAAYHDAWARRIIAGDWLGHGPDDVFKPPLYPYFLAGLYGLFGRRIALVQLIQSVLGALSCVFVAMLGARLLGRKTGRIAGLLSTAYGPYVFFELQMLTPTLSLFLNAAAVLLLVPLRKKPGWIRLLSAGMIFGLSAGIRPDVIVPAFLIVSYLLLRNYRIAWKQLATGGLCVMAGAASILVPISARNYYLVRQFIPISSNAGINFYIGNSAGADGITAVPVGLRWDALVGRVPQRILEKPAMASRWWTRAAQREIVADRAAFMLRLGKKALAFFNRREFRNNICYHFMQVICWPLRVSPGQFAVILPLAVCGLVCMRRSGSGQAHQTFMLCLLWVAGYWIVGIVFFVTARFRLPAIPFLILPAAQGITQLATEIRMRWYKKLIEHAGVVLVTGAICWPMWFGYPDQGWVRDNVNQGNSLIKAGDLDGARKSFGRALAYHPDDPDAHLLLGSMDLAKSPTTALKHLRIVQKVLPESPSLLYNLAQVNLAMGEVDQARETLNNLLHLEEKVNLWPNKTIWAHAHILLAEIEPPMAVEYWEKAWAIDRRTAAEALFLKHKELPRVLKTFQCEALEKPWDWYSQANLGMALLESDRAEEAAEAFRKAAKLAPEREGVRFHLARALVQMSRKEDALRILDQLARELPHSGLRGEVIALRERIRDGD